MRAATYSSQYKQQQQEEQQPNTEQQLAAALATALGNSSSNRQRAQQHHKYNATYCSTTPQLHNTIHCSQQKVSRRFSIRRVLVSAAVMPATTPTFACRACL
jgi:hypothetical protein